MMNYAQVVRFGSLMLIPAGIGAVIAFSPSSARAVLVLLILVPIAIKLVNWATRDDTGMQVRRVMVLGGVLLLSAALVRIVLSLSLYGSVSDAGRYHYEGARLASAFWAGEALDIRGSIPGTGFIEALTGGLYILIGPSFLAGTIFYSWLAFVGLVFCARAYGVANQLTGGRQYVLSLFLLPSLVFWPAAIGKDAWMTFTIGLALLGFAQITIRRRPGLVFIAAVCGAGVVRPHMALALCVPAIVSLVVVRAGRLGIARFVTLGLVVLVSIAVSAQVVSHFGTDDLLEGGAGQVLDLAAKQSSRGTSQIGGDGSRSVAEAPVATMSVLLRPFPWEAKSLQALFASLEGVVLLGVLIRHRHRVIGAIWRVRSDPMIAFAIIYTLTFGLAFSNVGNFGILVRQRIQVLPVALIILASGNGKGEDRRLRGHRYSPCAEPGTFELGRVNNVTISRVVGMPVSGRTASAKR